MKQTRIAIIGVGAVGATIAYAFMLKNIVSEIILIDIDVKRCAGEVKDLADTLGFVYSSISIKEATRMQKKADIVIIAAGRAQKPGQTRLELIDANKQIFKSVLDNLRGIKPEALLLIVANPLDLLTWYAHKHFELEASRMFGAGTFLDTQRLKHLLASHLSVAEESIQASIIGEHGDSQVVAWSSVSIGGNHAEKWGITKEMQQKYADAVKNEAYEIIQAKGATVYGIATCVATLCEIIIFNKKAIVPVSWYHEKYQVCLSLPVVLGNQGVERVADLALTDEENKQLGKSAMLLKEQLNSLQ